MRVLYVMLLVALSFASSAWAQSKMSVAQLAAYNSGNAQLRPRFANVGHTNPHYGNIITYMRMLGLKPPSS